ncbi:hypothetical protein TIFTF001_050653 [Ficus carica]|uniref:Uncharacterized protein n=1 Tax=Ficus carica TaxID=3494 RepID=A0AA88D8L7_FICCA|nr:hypothetical protein TIFTF001_050653 [Ficus carica]
MCTVSFSVITENHVLLDDFSTSNTISVKEFSVDVTLDNLVSMFIPGLLNQTLETHVLRVNMGGPMVSFEDVALSMAVKDWNVAPATAYENILGLPVYEDYVTVLTVSDKLRVSIGPSTLPGVDPNAILNGLEIMKIKQFRSTP